MWRLQYIWALWNILIKLFIKKFNFWTFCGKLVKCLTPLNIWSNIMETKILKINPDNIGEDEINLLSQAGELLKKGELVAFPTETVYGLGGDALLPEAAAKIYAAKGRPSDNPLIVHVSDIEQVYDIADNISDDARALMQRFWPGPLTIVFEKKSVVPDGTTGGLDTVAVRMPSHELARNLIRTSGVLIAAPSANTSGRPSPTKAEHVYDDLKGVIPMIIDGGSVGIGIESTIVDMTGNIPMILRPGAITKQMLEEVVPYVEVDKAILGPMKDGVKPKAPGMKYKHYAPKADLTIFSGEEDKVVAHINELLKAARNSGLKAGVIASDETIGKYSSDYVLSVGTRNDDRTIARNLYDVLRSFDDMEIDVIYGETFGENSLGYAIMNRLAKAAGYHIESV